MLRQEDRDFIRQILTFWDKLKPEDKDLLVKNTKRHIFHKDDNIHNGKDDCIGVILVKSGSLRTYILSEEGKEINLYNFSTGDICILSSSCMFETIDFDIFVDSESESELLIIDSKIFESISNRNIYAENFSLRKTVDRFSDVMAAIQEILFLSLDKRLANFLLRKLSKLERDTISMTHEEISKYLGSAREVVSRSLKSLESQGIIRLSRGKIIVVDKLKLRDIV